MPLHERPQCHDTQLSNHRQQHSSQQSRHVKRHQHQLKQPAARSRRACMSTDQMRAFSRLILLLLTSCILAYRDGKVVVVVFTTQLMLLTP